MDKLEYYRDTIKKILTEYYQMKVQGAIELDELEPDDRLAFDEERDQYLWFRSGWNGKERLRYMTMYLRIKDGKIWVEEDLTNLCVVDDLLAAGISKGDIVLGFRHPSKRPLTEFATV
ncbi:MAG: XisI protein [Tychonema bourrellyi B0820]|uniref:XisI protein n=1 Tax=Tychonema bourrellyi FEM_GT703 TaxID=2040638 RepID=A0A2G4F6I5_9CYAN|nr:XisI protein [Tychonema bourrellyi]MDQ2097218.1 XisI protein [Tychonema bourrellyi B0820]PHX57404.1 XisI protein [Tychonema bourrellyi FEM_GT703]